MKFKELIVLTDIDKTMDFLREHYYSDTDEKKREAQIIGYNKVVANLMTLTPEDCEGMKLCAEWVYHDKEWLEKFPEDKPYVDVFGRDGTLQKDTDDAKHFQTTDEKFLNSEVGYAIEFTPWTKWVDMEIHEDTLKAFSYEEILGHFLWEMTFVGWDQLEVQKEADKLKDIVDRAEEDIAAGKYKSLEETKESLNDRLNEKEE